jgi:hypothetical protein
VAGWLGPHKDRREAHVNRPARSLTLRPLTSFLTRRPGAFHV